VTDLLESPVMQRIFPNLYQHLKLVSSTPIRNMATIAGNFVNASPIGDMTIWFLALDAEISLLDRSTEGRRNIFLKDLFLDYKKLDRNENEIITNIRFRKPNGDLFFNFEKISKRKYLDIATVNTAISIKADVFPGSGWVPPALSDSGDADPKNDVAYVISEAHVSAGGVAPIPLYLRETSAFLRGMEVNVDTISQAAGIIQSEISPISDVRGSAEYKRLLLRQLFTAHFVELFAV
jgi:xanthine dehydrogenase small subunit